MSAGEHPIYDPGKSHDPELTKAVCALTCAVNRIADQNDLDNGVALQKPLFRIHFLTRKLRHVARAFARLDNQTSTER